MKIAPTPGLVVLIGGTGFIGTALAEVLARAGWQLRIAVRDTVAALRLKPLGDVGQIGAICADVRVPASLAAAVRGADVVVNLTGLLDEKGGQSFEDVHVKGAAAAATAAAQAGAKAFVHLSAIGADAASASAYGRSKAAGEAAVKAAFPAAAIVRPSLVFGAEDGFTNRFASLIASAPAVPVIAPGSRFQPVYVKDLAAALKAIIEQSASGIFEIGGPEVLSMKQILGFIAQETGHGEKLLVDAPDFGARLLAGLGFLPGAPLTKDQYLMLKQDNVVSGAYPGLAGLGIAATPLEAVSGQWLARYRAGGRFAA
ncbi:complex I NDUFA9 subunit family protein [Sandaracinobacter neustonicus]|uniref:Complex I NDUFA9 subunit family protein n=1 Tax=Sandaracinobacter neustonicus TaxID=1715348 RepID=A0A501XRG6_9SPHN|nr:complex I NDUFA9 subunit family protein [Sandaracinobacter neustonicus]TPE63332.1 complex I NDUFA9 subunit family protein [Sandaracinobacter neustonicus]